MKPKLFVKTVLRHGLLFINKSPKFRKYVLAIIHKFGLYSAARAFYIFLTRSSTKYSNSFMPANIRHLTPHARHIYVDLKAAIERCNKKESS